MKIMFIFLALAAGMISFAANQADDNDAGQAMHWVSEGKIMPLEKILELNKGVIQGRILDLELENKRGRIVYEIEWLDKDGIIHEAYVDPHSGKLLAEEIED